jgi:hypothetical protein
MRVVLALLCLVGSVAAGDSWDYLLPDHHWGLPGKCSGSILYDAGTRPVHLVASGSPRETNGVISVNQNNYYGATIEACLVTQRHCSVTAWCAVNSVTNTTISPYNMVVLSQIPDVSFDGAFITFNVYPAWGSFGFNYGRGWNGGELGSYTIGSTATTARVWRPVCLILSATNSVYTGSSSVRLFVASARSVVTNSLTVGTSISRAIRLGSIGSGSGHTEYTSLTDIRVYSRVLSDNEINSFMLTIPSHVAKHAMDSNWRINTIGFSQ